MAYLFVIGLVSLAVMTIITKKVSDILRWVGHKIKQKLFTKKVETVKEGP